MRKAVVILSGGMDSTTLLYDVLKNGGFEKVFALSFNYGQRHAKELDCAKATCEALGVEHKVVDMSFIGKELLFASSLVKDGSKGEIPEGHYAAENMKSTVVPNRNMIMLSLAAGYAISVEAEYLYYGAHAGDHTIYPDCRPEFIDGLEALLKVCDWKPVRLKAPYANLTKGAIAVKGKALEVDYSKSWTCYKGEEEACGVCGSCTERLEAFAEAGISDPIKYKGGN